MIADLHIETTVDGASLELTEGERQQLRFEIASLFPRLNGGTTIAALYHALTHRSDEDG